MQRKERSAETGREGRLGLLHARFGSRELRRVAREEMVHGLLVGKPDDRRQDAERVGREEEDVLRMSRRSGNQRIGDVPHRVRRPRILGQTV